MLTLLLLAQLASQETAGFLFVAEPTIPPAEWSYALPLDQGDGQTFIYIQEAPQRVERITQAAVIASAVAETAFTIRCWNRGTCQDTSPMLKWATSPIPFTITKAAMAALTLWIMDWLQDRGHPRAAAIVGWTTTGVSSLHAVQSARK